LSQEVLEEELFSERVDVHQMTTEPLTTLLSGVERHRRVNDRVLRTVDATIDERRPTELVCSYSK